MTTSNPGQYKTYLTAFAAIVSIYGILGWLDVGNYAQGGWNTDFDNNVTQVLPGSPSEAGGLQVGDHIVSLGGIATTDADALSRRARPKIGETWEFVVERDGSTVNLDVTFGEPVAQRKLIAHAAFLVGFCFIFFTMRAFLQQQNPSTFALGLFGTLFGLVFITGPYFDNYTLRVIDNVTANFLLAMGVASLLNFLLVHLRSTSNRLVYVPALLISVFIAWRILATPEATSALNRFGNIFVGGIFGLYMIASLVTVYRSYSSSSAAERDARGLNLMLIGTLIGLVPVIVGVLTSIVAPQIVLPGQNFYILTLVALPITWSMAVLKSSESAV